MLLVNMHVLLDHNCSAVCISSIFWCGLSSLVLPFKHPTVCSVEGLIYDTLLKSENFQGIKW